jgi:hypothetical protein
MLVMDTDSDLYQVLIGNDTLFKYGGSLQEESIVLYPDYPFTGTRAGRALCLPLHLVDRSKTAAIGAVTIVASPSLGASCKQPPDRQPTERKPFTLRQQPQSYRDTPAPPPDPTGTRGGTTEKLEASGDVHTKQLLDNCPAPTVKEAHASPRQLPDSFSSPTIKEDAAPALPPPHQGRQPAVFAPG